MMKCILKILVKMKYAFVSAVAVCLSLMKRMRSFVLIAGMMRDENNIRIYSRGDMGSVCFL